uniref:Uncharacterized protein n=1 Tax=Siphoviridae sp. ctuka10 TaxID=2825716 RepID=A0A8S5P9W4_9CAUD|nr:MAG TPA: hypothetical protein [Siphoviridae sp. ctuka10]
MKSSPGNSQNVGCTHHPATASRRPRLEQS